MYRTRYVDRSGTQGSRMDPEGGRACTHQAGSGRVTHRSRTQLQEQMLARTGDQEPGHTGPDAGMDTPR